MSIAYTPHYNMYNDSIYPNDRVALDRIDCNITVPFGCGGSQYLQLLKGHLPGFLNSIMWIWRFTRRERTSSPVTTWDNSV